MKQIRVSSLEKFLLTGVGTVSANPPIMHKIIGVREGILLEGQKKIALKINNLL